METNSQNSDVTVQKYPLWNLGQSFSTGSYQLVEFPLLYSSTLSFLPEAPTLTAEQEQKVAAASLNRIIILQTPGGQPQVRIASIVPRYQYAAGRNFDISNNSMRHLDTAFEGWLVIRKWNEEVVRIYETDNGQILKTLAFEQAVSGKAPHTGTATNSSYSDNCSYQEVTIWKQVCHQGPCTIPSDIPCINACATWELVPELDWQWVCTNDDGNVDCAVSSLPYEQCMCYYYGLNCTGYDDNPGDENYFDNNPCGVVDSLENDIGLNFWLGTLKNGINGRQERLMFLEHNSQNYIKTIDTLGILDSLGAPDVPLMSGYRFHGLLHNHFNTDRTTNIFTPGDFLTLGYLITNQDIYRTSTFVFGLVTPTNTNYTLFIRDSVKFHNYIKGFIEHFQAGQRIIESKYGEYDIKAENTPLDNERNFLKLLQTEKCGLTLLKNTTGSPEWKPLSLNNNQIIETPCE